MDGIDLTITELLGVPIEDWPDWMEQRRLSTSEIGEIARRLWDIPTSG